MGLIAFNLPGLVIAAAAALLSWSIVLLIGSGAETFLLLWTGIAGTAALFYDRLEPDEGLRAYYIWLSRRPHRSRIAGFGVPLVFVPMLVLIFAYLFPIIANDPLPSLFFFALLGPMAVFLIIAVVVKHRLSAGERANRIDWE